MRVIYRITYVLLTALLAVSCSGVRKCQKPQLDLPETFAMGNDSLTGADIAWWELYSDPALGDIIRSTLAHNRDFLAAAARVEEMRQLYGVAKADMFPTLGFTALADRETNNYHDRKHTTEDEYSIKPTLRWEADLWGGLTWARRQKAASFQASVEQQRAMQITLIAEAASAYFRLLALDNELDIARRTLYTREENLKKAKLRYEGGLTPQTVYRQAEVEYATTAALVPGLERQIEQQKNAITLLMGRYPDGDINRSRLNFADTLSEALPVGLPSDLLQRRPDIRAAEASLRSALANVGVRYSDRFPKLTIAFTGGWENNQLPGFFLSPFTYTVGSIAGTIFDFGRNKRKYRAALAAYEQSRLNYEQCVLEAFTEVDNAVTAFRLISETLTRRRDLYSAAQQYATLAYRQYNAGVINYIDVLDAQRRYFEAQVGLSNAVRDQYLAMVQLYKVLGGGWSSQETESTPPKD